MKVEVGKFYKTRGGQKVGPMEKKSYGWIAGNGRIEPLYRNDWYDDGNYNYYHAPSEHDLIEEWKEPEVKEPKFKVGDYIRQDEKYWKPEGYKVVKVTDDLVFLDPETGFPSVGYSKLNKWIVVEQNPKSQSIADGRISAKNRRLSPLFISTTSM